MNKAKETEKAHDEFHQPFLHIQKKKKSQTNTRKLPEFYYSLQQTQNVTSNSKILKLFPLKSRMIQNILEALANVRKEISVKSPSLWYFVVA